MIIIEKKKVALTILLVVGAFGVFWSYETISWIVYMLSSLAEPRSPYVTESYVYSRIYSDAIVPILSIVLPLVISAIFYWKEKYKMSIVFTFASMIMYMFWYSMFSMVV